MGDNDLLYVLHREAETFELLLILGTFFSSHIDQRHPAIYQYVGVRPAGIVQAVYPLDDSSTTSHHHFVLFIKYLNIP